MHPVKLLFTTILPILLLSPVPCRSQEETGDSLFYAGNEFLLDGNYRLASECYEKALQSGRCDSLIRAKCYNNLGGIAYLDEDFGSAALFFQKSLLFYLSFSPADPVRICEVLVNLGSVYAESGAAGMALAFFKRADSIARDPRYHNPSVHPGISINLASVYLQKELPDSALLFYEDALAWNLRAQDPEPAGIAFILKGMGSCHKLKKNYDRADSLYDKALELYDPDNGAGFLNRVELILAKGDLNLDKGDPGASLSCFDSALILIRHADERVFPGSGSGLPEILSQILQYRCIEGKAEALKRLAAADGREERRAEAFRFYREAIRIIDDINRKFGEDASRILFNEKTKRCAEAALDAGFFLSAEEGSWLPVLLSVSESVRNRLLLAGLRRNPPGEKDGRDSLYSVLKILQSEIVRLNRKLVLGFPLADETAKQAYTADLTSQLLLREQLLMMAQAEWETNERKDLSPEEFIRSVQGSLSHGEAILNYFLGESDWYCFIITPDTLAAWRQDSAGYLAETVRDFSRSLKNADVHEAGVLGTALYRKLILPAEELLRDKHHLVIIPDEDLSLIPFEALIREKNPQAVQIDMSRLPYLVYDFSFSYHYSVSSWLIVASGQASRNEKLSFTAYAPVLFDDPGYPGMSPLPGTEEEAGSISVLFERAGYKTDILTRGEATESRFRKEAPGNAVIHIATHSREDPFRPGSLALVFFPEDPGDPSGEDGNLYLEEAENLSLDSDLVVLSACSAGRGPMTRTENQLALSRAFLVAGARNVVCSLWNVRDNHTKTFMVEFYKNVLAGKSYPDALQSAKLTMLSGPETLLPLLWAGFVVLGR